MQLQTWLSVRIRRYNPQGNNFIHFTLHLAMWNVQKEWFCIGHGLPLNFNDSMNGGITKHEQNFFFQINFSPLIGLHWFEMYESTKKCSTIGLQHKCISNSSSKLYTGWHLHFTWPIIGETSLSRQPCQVTYILNPWITILY